MPPKNQQQAPKDPATHTLGIKVTTQETTLKQDLNNKLRDITGLDDTNAVAE